MQPDTVDFEAIKERQRMGWGAGDYPRVGNTLQTIAERLVEAADLHAGRRVLDVACGQGNAAIAGARRFAEATGVDYAADLLAQGRERAEAEHLNVTFIEGDAEQLPLPDGTFDLTLSTVGVMFAPNPERAAAELARVTRPGGKIALASWTPEGLVGMLFKTIGRYAPPPAGVKSPMLWGTENRLAELFGDKVEWVSLNKRTFDFCYHSPEHFSEWFRLYYGPITRLAGTLDNDQLAQFVADLAEVVLRGEDDGLTTSERAMADWARKVARDPNQTGAADVQALRDAGHSDEQIFGITVYVALRLAFSTVNDALGAQPDAAYRDTAPESVLEAVTFGRPIA